MFSNNPPPILSAPGNTGGPCLRTVMSPDRSTLAVESCSQPNGAIDPGDTVTLNFSLKNIGDADTSNLVATLRAAGGVILPSGPQDYGALTAGGPDVVRPFTFSATGACVGTLTATFQLQDGEVNLGTVAFAFPRDGVACSQTCSPRIIGVQLVGADVQISFVTVAGRSYRIEQVDSLLAPVVWTGVSGASGIAGTGGIVQGTDIGAAGQGGRFYRVVLLP